MTLVNIRNPVILESFLERQTDRVLDNDAFTNGVSSSIMIWRDSAGHDPWLEKFCKFEPDAANADRVGRWEEMVRRPCRAALDHYPVLKKHRQLDEVFRYCELSILAQRGGDVNGGHYNRGGARKG